MAYTIVLENCTGCSACEPECPNSAINSTDDGLYQIDPDLCTECVGFFDEAQCTAVCPIDKTCIPDPAFVEDWEVLMARKVKLHGS
jgi:ferredoxin